MVRLPLAARLRFSTDHPGSLGKARKSRVELGELSQIFDEGREVGRYTFPAHRFVPGPRADATRQVHPSTRRRFQGKASDV